jgi:dihydroorotase
MSIVLDSPLDMHLHLRDGDMLKVVAPLSSRDFSAAIIMPNLLPPITSIESLKSYKERIFKAIGDDRFDPLMTLFFKSDYDYEFLKEAKSYIKAVKLYPAGVTTNSKDGVNNLDISDLKETLDAMSELNIPLCVHGESSGFVMDREKEFVPIYEKLATSFPKLKIIMEHITTKDSVEALKRYSNLYATITLHHLYITLDNVAGGMLKPHLFCKPIAKRPEDREALLEVALSGYNKVMFGSDSAPHPKDAKEAPGCAAGVFTAPVALPALCDLFDRHGRLENLQAFISDNARAIYDFNPPKKLVTLNQEEFEVPNSYKDVTPMFAGDKLGWRVTSRQNIV